MEGKKACFPIPLQGPNQTQTTLDDPQKAEVLADYYKLKIDLPPTLHPPADLNQVINSAIVSPGVPELAQPFTSQELTKALQTLKTNKSPEHDHIPYEFLTHLTPQLQESLLLLYNTS